MDIGEKVDLDSQKKRPVIIGVGQYVHGPEDLPDIKKPLDLIEIAIHRAAEDAGLKDLARKIDTLCLTNILSRSPEGLPSELSQRLGATPKNEHYTWVGASAPQWFVNRTAEKIFEGKARIALVCGGEAFYSKRLKAKAKGPKAWDWDFPPKLPWMVGDLRDPLTSLEMKYGLVLPLHVYPLFENALRHYEALSIEEQRQELGEFCSSSSSIAAKNPYAWFKESKSSAKIVETSAENRMAAFPYTKFMCSIMEVDQAAALFLTDVQTAEKLGVPREKWIYLLGSGDASDIWNVSERVDFYSSPSVKVAAEKAMDQAGVNLEEIDYLDFYSCFPCAPRITRNMLGIHKDDPRPLTVTGGMPYFGGPGNSYSLHAICKIVEILRQEPDKIGLVQALSWFISKHSIGIYSAQPPKPYNPLPPESYQRELNKLKGPPLIDEAFGSATVETYTLFHDHQGRPVEAVIIGRLTDGSRFLAKPSKIKDLLTTMTEQEFINQQGKVKFKDGFNLFEL